MRNRRLTFQAAMIYAIIIVVFLGSALFFSYLNTDAMRTAVETETNLSSSFLSSSIDARLSDAPQGEKATRDALSEALDERLPQVLQEAEEDIDVWVVDGGGSLLFARGEAFPQDQWEAARSSLQDGDDVAMRWIGRRNLFWLNQSLLLARRLPGDDMVLVMINHCHTVNVLQRRQFALFAGIELVLVFIMVVVLTNTIFGYRRMLIQLATTDELTGLANRKSFQTTFQEFAGKQNCPEFSLFLVDVDYFKQVNDGYGHASGDAALKLLAGCIDGMVKRCGGFAGRWGGDEFIGVLPMGEGEALEQMQGLCAEVRSRRLDCGIGITISGGLAPAGGERELSRISERADKALYRSKAQGRNQANAYRPEDEGAPVEPVFAPAATSEAAPGKASDAPARAAAAERRELPLGQRIRRYIREKLLASTLYGVQWMAPFVAGGGILIGLAFLFDASSVDLAALPVAQRANFGSITALAASLKSIGDATFNFMLPAFAGFMAYGLAGENAFMAGFVGGYMTIESRSGFIGAMVAGFAAGVIATQMQQFVARMPKLIHKAAPIFIYPVFNLLVMYAVSGLIITPLSALIGRLFTGLLDSAVAAGGELSGALAGSMMALDMGGIVNKVAYNYGVAGLSAGNTALMASVMAGGMVPPLGIALSTLLYPRKYRPAERERTAGALFMGLCFITEGALPFVFTDVLRVIPACMAGSALAGLLSALFGCALPAPHGGIFVLPVMTQPILYLVALALGSLVTALILGGLKREIKE